MKGTPNQPADIQGGGMLDPKELNLLLVDDDVIFACRLGKALGDRGLNVDICTNVREAEALVRLRHFDILITDLRIGNESGLELLKITHEVSPNTKSLVLTGYGDVKTVVSAVKLGATEYLSKPADADEILEILEISQQKSQSEAPCLKAADEVRWEHINRVFAENDHNISATSRLLKLHRRTLQRVLARGRPRK